MKLAPQAAAWLCAVLCLSGCTDTLRDSAVAQPDAEAGIRPGYFATGTRITLTGVDGAPLYRIVADRIDQLSGSGEILLTRPRFDLNTARGNWRISAEKGDLPENASRLDLQGDVLLTSRVGPRLEPIEIRTASLSFDQVAGEARSSDRVTITLSGKTLAGTGLNANLKAQTVRLESKVNGRFLP